MSKAPPDPAAELEQLKTDLAQVRDDLGSLAGSLVKKGRQSAIEAKDSVKDHVTSSIETIGEFVEERPMTTVMLAFGAGFLTSMLLRRK